MHGPRDLPAFVTVDFDFFCAYPQTSCDLLLADGSRAPSHLAGPLTCPDEIRGDYVRAIEWNLRIQAARRCGIDVAEHFAVLPAYGSVSPSRMAAELAKRYRLAGVQIHAADSHRHTLMRLERAAECYGPLDLVSFDAHHDLGYDPDQLTYEEQGGQVTCGSWLLWALRRNLARTVTVVLPDWLDDAEHDTDPREFLGVHDAEVTITRWSDWTGKPTPPRRVCEMTVARSGWWTPPWCDPDLTVLIGQLTARGMQIGSVIEDALTEREHTPTDPAERAAAAA